MSIEELEGAVHALREAKLHRAMRGVDPRQARELLDEAADFLASAVREQKELRRELEQLQDTKDEEAIARALVAATRTAEEIVVKARAEAASITAEAEAQKAALLEQAAAAVEEREREATAARAQFEREAATARKAIEEEHESARVEAEVALAGARRELAQLEEDEARLRALMAETERRFVEIARAALDELEGLGSAGGSGDAAGVLGDLQLP
jgi:cell division septum initiation protein DivIVA